MINLCRVLSRIRAFGANRHGNFTTMLALSAPVLMFLVAAMVTYSDGVTYQQKLQSAADSAALVATRALDEGSSIAQAQTIGQDYFAANAPNFATAGGTLTVTPTETNGSAQTTVSYSVTMPPRVLDNIAGIDNMNINVYSTSVAAYQANTVTYGGSGDVYGDPHVVGANGITNYFGNCATTPPTWYDALSDLGIELNFTCIPSNWPADDGDVGINSVTFVIGSHVITSTATPPTVVTVHGQPAETYPQPWYGQVSIDGVPITPTLGTHTLATWSGSAGGLASSANATISTSIGQLAEAPGQNVVNINYSYGSTSYAITYFFDAGQFAYVTFVATNAGQCQTPGGVWGETLAGVNTMTASYFEVPSSTSTASQFNDYDCANASVMASTEAHLTR